MLEKMSWLNEPSDWSLEGGVLRAVTELRTDFWCETFYGWTTDNGHFFYQPVTDDFTAEVVVSANHTTRFDQAGMMVRADERNWLKSGLEVTSGAVQISTVYTREFSDVSMAPLAGSAGEVSMRVTRFGTALAVHCRRGREPMAVAAPRSSRPPRHGGRRHHVLLAGACRAGSHVPGLPDRAAANPGRP